MVVSPYTNRLQSSEANSCWRRQSNLTMSAVRWLQYRRLSSFRGRLSGAWSIQSLPWCTKTHGNGEFGGLCAQCKISSDISRVFGM
ncbi:hypothetical protein GOP47_0007563 [Adiantum capillus-veneris]|uniref:Uncharacterized protein n=1 Tax=Adiantum capillus-veneris TaxID=13818 RepID=A0A9D4ZJF0_ADICA|nr:hypothetical protein GOP47_0007563 [Adiantum capillus-veneris]